MNILLTSKLVSFTIQIIAAIIGIYALFQKIPAKHLPLQQSLAIEMFVQAIQMTMYIWLIFNLYLPSMSLIRYIDWFITTPLMLISLVLYFNYEQNIYENKNTELFNHFIKNNKQIIFTIIISNSFMLLFGIAGELNYIDKKSAILGGFISLFITLSIIYKTSASKSKKGMYLFIPFSITWSLYGIAYILPELQKNIFYNILDTIAKNFFGIFLSIKVLFLT